MRGLVVGVDYFVGRLPMEIEGATASIAMQLVGGTIIAIIVGAGIGHGGFIHADALCLGVSTLVIGATHRETHGVVACVGISVQRILLC